MNENRETRTLWEQGFKVEQKFVLDAVKSLATITPELVQSISSGDRNFVFVKLTIEEEK